MSSPNPAAHPAQDADAGLAGIRVLGSGQGAVRLGVGGTAEGDARARQQTVPTRRTSSEIRRIISDKPRIVVLVTFVAKWRCSTDASWR
jgi:hypothetical protein